MESSSSSLRSNSSSLSLLELPVICLETANFDGTLGDVIATHPTTVLGACVRVCVAAHTGIEFVVVVVVQAQ